MSIYEVSIHNDLNKRANYHLAMEALNEIVTTEDDEFRPTLYAFETTKVLLSETVIALDYDIGDPYIAPDGDGGICIDWNKDTRMIRLVVKAAPDKRGYIYHEENKTDYNVSYGLNSGNLCYWLQWLNMHE